MYLLETSGQKETTKDVMEVEIDQLLKKRDGLIQRDRDPQLTLSLSLSPELPSWSTRQVPQLCSTTG